MVMIQNLGARGLRQGPWCAHCSIPMARNRQIPDKESPKNNFHFWRSDLGEIWPVRLSKTAGITGYSVVDSTLREDFVIEEWSKMARR